MSGMRGMRAPSANKSLKPFNFMKKALWLQLPRFRPNETLDRLTDELTQYKRSRSVARRTPQRAEQERLYQARVKEWLRLPENRYCQVYLLLQANAYRRPNATITRAGAACSCFMSPSGFPSVGKATYGLMTIANGPGRWVYCARWAGTIHPFTRHKASNLTEVERDDLTNFFTKGWLLAGSVTLCLH